MCAAFYISSFFATCWLAIVAQLLQEQFFASPAHGDPPMTFGL